MNQFGKRIGVCLACLALGVLSGGLARTFQESNADSEQARASTTGQGATTGPMEKAPAQPTPTVAKTSANDPPGMSEQPLQLYGLDEWVEVPATLLKAAHVPSLRGMLAAGNTTATNYLSSSGLTKLLKLNSTSEGALNKALANAMSNWATSATKGADNPEQGDAKTLQFKADTLAQIQTQLDLSIDKILSAEQAHIFRARTYRDLQFLFGSERIELKLVGDDVEISGELSNGTTSFTRSNIVAGSPLAILLAKIR